MKKEFLGTGWSFPIVLETDGRIVLSAENEDIREAIVLILSTAPGERVMRPEFGCGIHEYVFSVINSSNLLLIGDEVKRALVLYEPRITVDNIQIQPNESDGSRLMIHIEYTVLSSNSRFNMVYPFYLTEKG